MTPLGPGSVVLGRYRLDRPIGVGGVGRVFLATRDDGTEVAVKVLAVPIDQALERFEREARLMAGVGHPGLVEILDYGVVAGMLPCIVMEYLAGETLEDRLEEKGAFAWRAAMKLFMGILAPLEALHRAGLLHRDLKPANVMLLPGEAGRIKLLDLGIATAVDGATTITQQGHLVGTPAYMAPEQLGGAVLDPRTDLYSAGVMLYEMLSGDLPFPDTGIAGVIARATERSDPPVAPKNLPELPVALQQLVLQMMEVYPERRPGSVSELRNALRRVMRRSSSQIRRVVTTPEVKAGAWIVVRMPPSQLVPGARGLKVLSRIFAEGEQVQLGSSLFIAAISGESERDVRGQAGRVTRSLRMELGDTATVSWTPAESSTTLAGALLHKRLPTELAERIRTVLLAPLNTHSQVR